MQGTNKKKNNRTKCVKSKYLYFIIVKKMKINENIINLYKQNSFLGFRLS